MLDGGQMNVSKLSFAQTNPRFALLARWFAVAIILGHLFSERFGGVVAQSTHPTIIAIYFFILAIGFGLPALEKTGRQSFTEFSKLFVVDLSNLA